MASKINTEGGRLYIQEPSKHSKIKYQPCTEQAAFQTLLSVSKVLVSCHVFISYLLSSETTTKVCGQTSRNVWESSACPDVWTGMKAVFT